MFSWNPNWRCFPRRRAVGGRKKLKARSLADLETWFSGLVRILCVLLIHTGQQPQGSPKLPGADIDSRNFVGS
ncbi:uncharacterized protein DFL_001311 [Arthrobotrys flagrans]|uniref:Uncharacterized protein n=1 Tax=Arthrobotrys flagrans TaxID=97331 RepID=A0A437AGY9_ARTFL|nr:hypothetical protein DFL_001311 [Arthrobotrys flagrans]